VTTSPAHSLDRSAIAVQAVFLVLVGVYALHALRFDFLIDDAYITFRYARNLAEGHGLVFNTVGERVEGFSNLLWALLLALGLKLGVTPEVLSRALGFPAGLAVLFLVRDATRRVLGEDPASRWLSLVPVAFLALNRSFAAWTTGGLETRLHALLVVLAAWLLDREVRRGAGPPISLVAIAALVLVRVDGFVQVVFLSVGWLAWNRGRPGRRGWILMGTALAVLIGVSLFRAAYYGDPVPNTVHAKVAGPAIASGLAYIVWAVRDYGLFLLLPLGLAGWKPREGGPFVTLALVTVMGQLAYLILVGGDHFEYRLLDPVWPLCAVLAVVGGRRLFSRVRGPAARVAVASVAVLGLLWNGLPALAGFEDRKLTTSVETEAFLCLVWSRVGDWFGEHAAPDEVIALRPVGVIPYRSRLPAFDMLGLNDRIVARRPPTPGEEIPGHRKLANWDDVLVRGRASYVLDEPDFRPERPVGRPEPPRVIEAADRRFALIPVWADLGDFWLRFEIVSEEAVTDQGVDPSFANTRIRPESN
jgi:hypothetical protein